VLFRSILALMLLRLLLRSVTAHPPAATTGSSWLDRIAWLSHRAFYPLVFAMALSGAVMALQAGLFDIVYGGHGTLPPDLWVYKLRSVHYVISRALMTLIALHITGAFYHVLFRGDGLLRRMSFGRRVPKARGFAVSKVQP